jgi:hypothetical protein
MNARTVRRRGREMAGARSTRASDGTEMQELLHTGKVFGLES